jgi:formylglycine-generating enzyme required for sulfatase activity
MKSCLPIISAAALLIAADEPKQGMKNFRPAPDWLVAAEGSGNPSNQNATDDAIRADQNNSDQYPISGGVVPRLVLGRRQTLPDQIKTRAAGIRLTPVPAGTFPMGLPHEDADDEHKPQHEVRISAFYLGVTEVTRGQFRQFVQETKYTTEAERDGKGGWGWKEEGKSLEKDPKFTWLNPGFEQTDEHRVVNVSWNDALTFCEWLTRAEGGSTHFPTF